MEYIAHRINTVEQLRSVPSDCGIEIDLRDMPGGMLYLQHDPFVSGENFESFLQEYHHGTMIINVKSERIEMKVRELLKQKEIKNYFFLDCSFPMVKLLTDMEERRIALRYSEYEGMDTLRRMAGLVLWVWVDCFTRMPLTKRDYKELKDLGYRICLVSPDIVGREEKIEAYRAEIEETGIVFDAVCGKLHNRMRWNNL